MSGKWAAAHFFFRWTQVKIDTERIVAAAEAVAQDEMVELVDVEGSPGGPPQAIRVFIDREGGARLRDCETFSRRLAAILDVEDPVRGPYILEVSTPGVNRRLKQPKHFAACRGRRVRGALSAPVGGGRDFRGGLLGRGGE